MKCENCGNNEVSFVYQSNVNGNVTEKRLCAECAEKLGYTQKLAAHSRRMMRSLFGGNPFEDFFSPFPSLLDRGMRLLEDPFDGFFSDMPALGAPEEEPRQPQKAQEDLLEKEEREAISKTRQLNALRMELQRAVQEENFERAIELRDQIRGMEQE